MLKKFFADFSLDGYSVTHLARILPVLGAFLSIALIAGISRSFGLGAAYPVLIASMGASAVLLFVVPSSPMAQPWPFVGGHLISAFIGVLSFQLIPDVALAAALAVSLSVLAMMYLGCLHPPGGAASLAFILGGPEIQALGFQYLLLPVATNVILMLVLSQLFNNARFLFKRPPRVKLEALSNTPGKYSRQTAVLFTESDLEAALKDMGTFIDISHEDLYTIYSLALSYSQIRNYIGKTCQDIMFPALYTIEFGSSLEEAWGVMQDNDLHGMVVIDRSTRVIGIITITDFIEHADSFEGEQIENKIEILITPSRLLETTKPEVVGQIMSSPVIAVNIDDDVTMAFTIFKKHEAYLLPVVNAQNKLQGLIAAADLQ